MNNQCKQMTLKERYQIGGLNELVFSARVIVINMKRVNKTIALELKRYPNRKQYTEEAYTNTAMIRAQVHKFTKRSKELID